MNFKFITINGVDYTRIGYPTAKRLYNEGEELTLFTVNANPNSEWNTGYVIQKNEDNTFEKIVTSFEHYNCNNEMGKYAKFYVREKD